CLPRFSSLVQLKNGTEEPLVFITHGIGGNVMDFFQLVKHIRSPHPIYGMQAKGLDGSEEPFDRIEDMAKFFLNAIKEVQPQGPYLLIGYSLGGLVALEMAQHLSESGEKVALLALLESYPHRRHLSANQRIRLLGRLLRNRITTLIHLRPREAFSYILHPAERFAHVSRNGGKSGRSQLPLDVWFTPEIMRMRDRSYLALKHYRPRYYPGKIHFVRAERSTEFPSDPRAVWGNLAAELEVDTVPGDHLEIVNTHFERLGRVLSRYLQEAAGRVNSSVARDSNPTDGDGENA
ncbi:MAG TPA: alpha/beta fold hydrolase, partial [Candidatus Dormibacteraeota bacterium]|nr:alpha/beta fold hydrolase [Candidatus Dormibacteraeota bacterium]